MGSSDQPLDVLSENNAFYKDDCYIFTSEDGTDVLLQDRLIEYNYNNKICQKGCELQKINTTTGEAFCLCQPNTGFVNVSNIEEIMNEDNNIINEINSNSTENTVTYQKYSAVNAKVLKCSKNIGVNFFKNYILIIFTLLLIGFITISVIFFIKRRNLLKEFFDKHDNNVIKKIPKKENVKCNPPKPTFGTKNIGSKEYMVGPKDLTINIKYKLDLDVVDFGNVKDNRSFIEMFKSSLKKRLILFSCIEDNNIILLLKILLLVFTIINYIVTNAFFFTEKNIHQIYLDNGKYNFGYQAKYIVLASLISSAFLYLSKWLITVKKKFIEENNSLYLRIWIFIGVSICLFIFYWVYLGSLTSTYINAKNHLIINSIITFLFCNIWECFLSVISVVLRRISLDKKIPLVYNISKFINLL